jgi:hypothetical protein
LLDATSLDLVAKPFVDAQAFGLAEATVGQG